MATVSADVRLDAPTRRKPWYVQHQTGLAYLFTALIVAFGWVWRDRLPIEPQDGTGYWLGIVGASLMGLLLLYPVRKRYRFMRIFGSTTSWFRLHMMFGIVGPVLILYHCKYNLGSLNSKVALLCTLLVAGSGLVGRYVYAKIHNGLYGKKASLKELSDRARLSVQQEKYTAAFVPGLLEAMGEFDKTVVAPPSTVLASMLLPIQLAVRTRLARIRLNRFVREQLHTQVATGAISPATEKKFRKVMQSFIGEHLKRVRRVAEFNFFERVFSLWHLLHLPFLHMLVVTALIHVLAVHMY